MSLEREREGEREGGKEGERARSVVGVSPSAGPDALVRVS